MRVSNPSSLRTGRPARCVIRSDGYSQCAAVGSTATSAGAGTSVPASWVRAQTSLFSQSSARSTENGSTKVRSTRSRVPPSRVLMVSLGSDAAVQCLSSDDPFADLQVPAHPSQCQRSDSRLIVVGHRATSTSGRQHAQNLFPRRRWRHCSAPLPAAAGTGDHSLIPAGGRCCLRHAAPGLAADVRRSLSGGRRLRGPARVVVCQQNPSGVSEAPSEKRARAASARALSRTQATSSDAGVLY